MNGKTWFKKYFEEPRSNQPQAYPPPHTYMNTTYTYLETKKKKLNITLKF